MADLLGRLKGQDRRRARRSAAGRDPAFSEGQPYGSWYHQDPDLQVLADYPPLQELMRPR